MPNFKNERPRGALYGFRNPLVLTPMRMPDKAKFADARINMGMITTIDSADLDPGALQLARNADVTFDRTTRRFGTILMTPSKPDSLAVLNCAFMKKNNGDGFFYRFTKDSIYHQVGGAWVQTAAGSGGLLDGTETDRYQTVVASDRFIFANNGANVIQEIDTVADEYIPLGNAPEYKYITGFANRIVGANLGGASPNGAQIGWSGDLNIDEWDPLVDESAGFTPLVDSPSDLGDFITGVFGFANYMIVMREQSIWMATKQPIPSEPFNFYTAFPGIGSDCPGSIVVTLNGVTWVDQRTATVWNYQPGQAPVPIGRSIENELMAGLNDRDVVFASYNSIKNKYTVCIPQVGANYVTAWTYDFRSQGWTKNEYEGVTSLDDVDFSTGVVTIDQLPDIPIDQLTGTIDELSPDVDSVPTRMFGRNEGNILVEDQNAYTDPPLFGSQNTTGKFTTELVSKSFSLPTDDGYFAEVRIGYIPRAVAPMSLYYSRNGGRTWNTDPITITPDASKVGEPCLFRLVRQVLARRFSWKLVIEAGQIEVIEYEVHVFPGGESRK